MTVVPVLGLEDTLATCVPANAKNKKKTVPASSPIMATTWPLAVGGKILNIRCVKFLMKWCPSSWGSVSLLPFIFAVYEDLRCGGNTKMRVAAMESEPESRGRGYKTLRNGKWWPNGHSPRTNIRQSFKPVSQDFPGRAAWSMSIWHSPQFRSESGEHRLQGHCLIGLRGHNLLAWPRQAPTSRRNDVAMHWDCVSSSLDVADVPLRLVYITMV